MTGLAQGSEMLYVIFINVYGPKICVFISQFFAEVEPTVVWLMNSFYKEHLASRTDDDMVRPVFGNMSNSLVKHGPGH